MQKIFYIKSRKFKEISDGRGSVEYLLLDEKGDERIVTAIAKLNRFNEPSRIRPVYKRETLLVKALSKASVNDRIHIDFTKFNGKNPRSVNTKRNSKQEVASMYGGFSEFQYLLSDKLRLSQLFLMGGAGFIGFLFIQGSF